MTPWTVAHQASLSIINSRSLLKLMFIESVLPSNYLILCCPLLLLLSIFPRIRVFSKLSALSIRWPEYWSFGFSITPCNSFPLGLTGLITLLSSESQESSPAPQFESINSSALSLLYGEHKDGEVFNISWSTSIPAINSEAEKKNNRMLNSSKSFCFVTVTSFPVCECVLSRFSHV